MLRRRVIAPAVALLVALGLTACTPGEVTPTPTPTGISEDEAYAQAEEVYRAYIAAQNQVVPSDPSTFEPVYGLTTGRQNSLDRQEFSLWYAKGFQTAGQLNILWLDPQSISKNLETIRLTACLDTSQYQVANDQGVSQKSNDARDRAEWTVGMVRDTPSDSWLIEATAIPEDAPDCEER